MLANCFEIILHNLGMEQLESPLFYHAPVAIRFEIGGDEPVYLAGSESIPYHLYNDRGLDVLDGTRELLFPLYHRFHSWILDYDRERINRVFSGTA